MDSRYGIPNKTPSFAEGLFIEGELFLVVISILIPSQVDQEVLSLDHKKWEVNF